MSRVVIASAALIAATSVSAFAQAVRGDFVYGRDYTFERMEAVRPVNDAEDTGAIRLVSYVYRPVRNDRRDVVLYSHGSTGGLMRSPKEALDAPPPAVIRYFVSRGYTLVAPLRRGRGESTGTYVEECSVFTRQCTTVEQVALTDRGIREALLDTNAVIDQVILGRLAPPGAKIVIAGHSRGGFLSLLLAAARPTLAKAVINFAAGWLGVTDNITEAENRERMELHTSRLERAAKTARVPTIWIYAVRDPFYREGFAEELLRSWRDAGGQAEFVHVTEHRLPNAHLVPTDASLWQKPMDAFMTGIESAK